MSLRRQTSHIGHGVWPGSMWRGSDRPIYERVLRLRRVRLSHLVSGLLLEGTAAVAVLMSMAALVSWWSVLVLPIAVAALVKLYDIVIAAAPVHPWTPAARGVARVAVLPVAHLPIAHQRTIPLEERSDPVRWAQPVGRL